MWDDNCHIPVRCDQVDYMLDIEPAVCIVLLHVMCHHSLHRIVVEEMCLDVNTWIVYVRRYNIKNILLLKVEYIWTM